MVYTATNDGQITIGDNVIMKIRGVRYHSCSQPIVFYKGDSMETDEILTDEQALARYWKKQEYVKDKKVEA